MNHLAACPIAITMASIGGIEIVAAITACIDLVVSIASVFMGALHLNSNECHQAATFVLVNGGNNQLGLCYWDLCFCLPEPIFPLPVFYGL